jgi:hypothetical protein
MQALLDLSGELRHNQQASKVAHSQNRKSANGGEN